ncbi:histidine kinase [Microbacterium sp. X-17]|uniref:histidine kinase n=1 Tax=Microbacterium sp. X-17 TaxID=3144404 RepID=UPI0031F52FA9
MSTTILTRLAALLVLLEGIGLVFLTGWQVVAMLGGDTDSLTSALALAVLTAVAAAGLIAFGVAIGRGSSWGRSGGVVAQLLILAVAIGAFTGAYAEPLTGLWIALVAIVGLVLLVLVIWRTPRPPRPTD